MLARGCCPTLPLTMLHPVHTDATRGRVLIQTRIPRNALRRHAILQGVRTYTCWWHDATCGAALQGAAGAAHAA